MPVIVEDEVLVGGNCGVYEGNHREAARRAGHRNNSESLNAGVRRGAWKSSQCHEDRPLVIPEGAVVVAGSRAITHGPGKEWNLSLYTPVIVKYRDTKTDAKVQLEDLLR